MAQSPASKPHPAGVEEDREARKEKRERRRVKAGALAGEKGKRKQRKMPGLLISAFSVW
jgi:hypothetical protein